MSSVKILILLAGLLTCINLNAASVWKVSNGQQYLYLAGTVHLLSDDDYPLPKEYQQAYKSADTLVFETDMQAISSGRFQRKTLQLLTYSDETTLESVLSADTYQQLKQYLGNRNVDLDTMRKYKPSLMAVTLSMLEFQALGLTSIGVDQYFSEHAISDGKQQTWLESPEQQLAFLAAMGKGQEDQLIAYTLRDIKGTAKMMNDLKRYWRDGDMQSLAELGIMPLLKDYPQIYQDMLVKRNKNWLPKLEQILNSSGVEMVLVGAMHLAGEDSVLRLLNAKGYTIEKL